MVLFFFLLFFSFLNIESWSGFFFVISLMLSAALKVKLISQKSAEKGNRLQLSHNSYICWCGLSNLVTNSLKH